MLKKILKKAAQYEKYTAYVNTMKEQALAQQDQPLTPFDISSSVEKEILAQKELKRKARNKRKANK